jgi:hypothetical protein
MRTLRVFIPNSFFLVSGYAPCQFKTKQRASSSTLGNNDNAFPASARVGSERRTGTDVFAKPTAITLVGINDGASVVIQDDRAQRTLFVALGASPPCPRDASLLVYLGYSQPDGFLHHRL